MRQREIFVGACELDDPGARASFLADACQGDAALRQQVEQLLREREGLDSFLEPSPMTLTAVDPREEIGSFVGPYNLRELLGEGGFGVVYEAEQKLPVRRMVALKLIKPGMDSREVLARFEAERQTLALMDHPNIARVLDAGTTDRGRPYFVMELVRGIPITKFCDTERLTVNERLKIFIDVCRAVQHAHLKAVIHRDLKPTNILVTLHDGKAVPKVIDFGVAKALQHKLTEKTMITSLGQMIGTPMYMSPEQAEVSGLDVDIRSDVYSLGGVLYELVTGTTPFEKAHLNRVSFDELRRIIRQDEPIRPSLRISTVKNESPTTISNQCPIDAHELPKTRGSELDWVVMKALEKDRDRRYQSPAELADDIQCFLVDLPVSASQPSQLYRLRKFAARNRLRLIATSFVIMSMCLGTGFSIRYAIQAGDALRKAEQSELLAVKRLALFEREQQKLVEAEVKRVSNYGLAKRAIGEFVDDVAQFQVPGIPELARLRLDLLARAEDFYTELLNDNPGDVELYMTRARLRRISERYSEVIEDLERAVAVDPDDFLPHSQLADVYRMNVRIPEKALEHALHAVELDSKSSHAWKTLGRVYETSLLDQKKAIEAMWEAVRVEENDDVIRYTRLASALRLEGRLAEAAGAYHKAAEADAYGSRSKKLYILAARMLRHIGNYHGAIEYLNETIEHNSNEPLESALVDRAHCYCDLKRFEEAVQDLELVEASRPGRASLTPKLFECYLRSGNTESAARYLDRQSGELLSTFELLVPTHMELVKSLNDGKLTEAYDRLCDRFVATQTAFQNFAGLADACVKMGHDAVAIEAYGKAIERTPNDVELLNRFAWYLTVNPNVEFRDPVRACELAQRATELDAGPKAHNIWGAYGTALYYAGRYQEAIHALKKAPTLAPSDKQVVYDAPFLAMAYHQLHDDAEAERYLAMSEERLRNLQWNIPEMKRFCDEARTLIRGTQ